MKQVITGWVHFTRGGAKLFEWADDFKSYSQELNFTNTILYIRGKKVIWPEGRPPRKVRITVEYFD